MILENFQYLYDITNIIKAMIAPNIMSIKMRELPHTINVRMIGSRFSAKTIQSLKWLIELGYLKGINIKTDIWRYEPKGAGETFEELMGTMEDLYNITPNRNNTNISKRTIKLPNNTINVRGLMSNRKKSTPKLGTARKGIKKDIQINVFEEATEFDDEKQIAIMRQATGGAKLTINILIANPWINTNWYVKEVAKRLPFNEEELKTKGQQFKSTFNDGVLEITHISNHRINTYLSISQHQELFDAHRIDPQLGKVVDYGMPGLAVGLVYAPILHMLMKEKPRKGTLEFRAGLDIGVSTGANASATSLTLGRLGKGWVSIEDEYFHSNQNTFKNQRQLAKEIIEKTMEYIIANKPRILQTETRQLTLAYDFAAFGWGDLLEYALEEWVKKTNKRVVAQMLDIVACVKYRVPTRITIITSMISSGALYIDNKCQTLLLEMGNSAWDETRMVKDMPTRENKNDHCLDAMEYMIGENLMDYANTSLTNLHKNIDTTLYTSSFS